MPPWRNLSDNDYQSLESFGIDLSYSAKHPYFISIDTLFNNGALGGIITRGEDQGAEAAKIIKEVLEKGGAEDVPVVTGQTKVVIEYALMKENHLNFSALPDNTIFINKPLTIWEKHYNAIILTSIIILLVVVWGIAYLIILRKLLNRGRTFYSSIPARIGVINRN